jgi:hypothetical protein
LLVLAALMLAICMLENLQILAQAIASERVAQDLRARLIERIALQNYYTIEAITPAKLTCSPEM